MNQERMILISAKELEELLISTINKIFDNKLNGLERNSENSAFITRKKAADILGISLVTLSDWIKRDIIPAYRVGTRVRIKEEDVLNALTRIDTIKYKRS